MCACLHELGPCLLEKCTCLTAECPFLNLLVIRSAVLCACLNAFAGCLHVSAVGGVVLKWWSANCGKVGPGRVTGGCAKNILDNDASIAGNASANAVQQWQIFNPSGVAGLRACYPGLHPGLFILSPSGAAAPNRKTGKFPTLRFQKFITPHDVQTPCMASLRTTNAVQTPRMASLRTTTKSPAAPSVPNTCSGYLP